jgi:DNA excision repair protein ERCC-1
MSKPPGGSSGGGIGSGAGGGGGGGGNIPLRTDSKRVRTDFFAQHLASKIGTDAAALSSAGPRPLLGGGTFGAGAVVGTAPVPVPAARNAAPTRIATNGGAAATGKSGTTATFPTNGLGTAGASGSSMGAAASRSTFQQQFSWLKDSEHYTVPPPTATGARPYPTNIPTNCILVNVSQKDNQILKHIRNVAYELSNQVVGADFLVGKSAGAVFLSLRYHALHKEYIYARLREFDRGMELRVLLVLCDVKTPEKALHDLSKLCVIKQFTLIVAWTYSEAGRYLETLKAYENKPPEMLMGIKSQDYLSQLRECMTSIKSVNKTDVVTLLSTFGTLKDTMDADVDELQLCPGFGAQKAERIRAVFHTPFKKKATPSQFGGSGKKAA